MQCTVQVLRAVRRCVSAGMTRLTSGLLVVFSIQRQQLAVAPVTQLQQGVLVHCLTGFLMVQRYLHKMPSAMMDACIP